MLFLSFWSNGLVWRVTYQHHLVTLPSKLGLHSLYKGLSYLTIRLPIPPDIILPTVELRSAATGVCVSIII